MCALGTGVQTCALPIYPARHAGLACRRARMAAAGPLLRRAAARHRRPRRLAAATAAAGDATAGFLRKAVGSTASVRSRAARHCTAARSEEHTSELQSLMRSSYAVLCLTKKNKPPPDTD